MSTDGGPSGPPVVELSHDNIVLLEEASKLHGAINEYHQLESGRLRSQIKARLIGELVVRCEHTSHRVEVVGQGVPASQMVLIAPRRVNMVFLGHEVGDELLVVQTNTRMRVTAKPGVPVFAVAINGLPDTNGGAHAVSPVDPAELLAFEDDARQLLTEEAPDAEDRAKRLASRLRDAVERSVEVPEPKSDWSALAAVRSYIDAHMDEEIRVSDMCEAGDMSQSTLERTFRRYLDTTPKRYMRTRRLDLVRRALTVNTAGATIAEIARAHGIGHLGRFSVDFREHFGFSPSDVEVFASAAAGLGSDRAAPPPAHDDDDHGR